jgi:hypothetical protein
MHPGINMMDNLTIPEFKNIAVALDFSENDQKLIEFAMARGKKPPIISWFML